MKKLIIMAVLLLSLSSYSQKVYNLDLPKTEQQLIGKAKPTNDTAILKGVSHQVWVSAKGKYFIVYRNKKGNFSKKYLN